MPGVTSRMSGAGEDGPDAINTILTAPSRKPASPPAARSLPSTSITSGGALARSAADHSRNGRRSNIRSCSEAAYRPARASSTIRADPKARPASASARSTASYRSPPLSTRTRKSSSPRAWTARSVSSARRLGACQAVPSGFEEEVSLAKRSGSIRPSAKLPSSTAARLPGPSSRADWASSRLRTWSMVSTSAERNAVL